MSNVKIFKVHLKRLKDWIVATSDSEDLKGLYLADPSYDAVKDQIPSAIKMLYKAKHGKDVTVRNLSAENDSSKQSTDTIEFLAEVA